ncbi:MAG: hypothetical protein RAK20_06970, partial [Conexivisphaerales archaeon]|nr:hypothetical protein [Conexivisphaerales archaeon]
LRILKDRDHPVEWPLRYITVIDQFRILDPSFMLSRPVIGKLSKITTPQNADVQSVEYLGNRVLIEMDMVVEDVRSSLLKKMLMADYLRMGYKVNYLIGPNENRDIFFKDLTELTDKIEKLNIISYSAKDSGYKAENMKFPASVEERNAVNFINLLAEEDFAIKDPIEYEIFVREQVKKDLELNRITYIMGHTGQEAMKIQLKYANIVRKITVTDGFLFWRSIRPLGFVYYVDINPENGIVEFMRVG